MATIRSYTTIEQSKVLAEILPLESADMCYTLLYTDASLTGQSKYNDFPCVLPSFAHGSSTISCWSLAALLNYLKSKDKFPEIGELGDGRFKLTTYIWDGENSIQVSIGDNLIDACYEMIIKLNKLNLL